jgi:hypothetical protein
MVDNTGEGRGVRKTKQKGWIEKDDANGRANEMDKS